MNNTSNPNATATAGAHNLSLEAQEPLDGRFMVSLTPTSSVAAMGLASMRYDQAPTLSHQQQQQYLSALSSHVSTTSNSPAAMGLRRSLFLDSGGSPAFGHIQNQIMPAAIARTLTIGGTTAVQRQGIMANPITRYLSSLEAYGSGSQQNMQVNQLGQSQMQYNQQQQQGVDGHNVSSTVVPSMSQTPAYLTFGSPIATTATTPAIFVSSNTSMDQGQPQRADFADSPQQQQQQHMQPIISNTPENISAAAAADSRATARVYHGGPAASPLPNAGTNSNNNSNNNSITSTPVFGPGRAYTDADVSMSPSESRPGRGGTRGRGRARGRGRGRGASSTAAAATGISGMAMPRRLPEDETSGHNRGPSTASDPSVGGWAADVYNESWVIRMDDLVERGAVTRVPEGKYQINADILSTGRSSITIGAAVGGDKRRFNLKWLYEYPWLRFEPNLNAMLCAMCKQCKRANQFAKRGSRNFKTSALVDHSSSNDHQKSIANTGSSPKDLLAADPTGAGVVLMLEDGMWRAKMLNAKPVEHKDSVDGKASGVQDAAGSQASPLAVPKQKQGVKQKQKQKQPERADAGTEQRSEAQLPSAAIAAASSTVSVSAAQDAPNGQEQVVDRRMAAQPSASVDSYITADSITTVASRGTPTIEGIPEEPQQQQPVHQLATQTSSTKTLPPVPSAFPESRTPGPSSSQDPLITAGVRVARKISRETTHGSASTQPDERYAREFEHAVQALLQAMRLNLPISAVTELYCLQMQPTPVADIGVGRSALAKESAVRLAGAQANGTEAARILQHVVSSEILSLVKDEVSQSPAFSVIIDEAPLREHNSLVAHVLLYLRYLRRDPTEEGGLQVVTRFWRCMHLYHEHEGRLVRRDATGLVLSLLDRAKVDTSRLVCVSCERPATREDEEVERRRRPHVIHWHGIYTYANSLSPQVYEEVIQRSDDFVRFAMTLMDLCLFMYSHPSRFAFLGADFQEMLYKTLYEIFLGEGSLSTRLPISLTPAIVIAITRNISQIMATVVALSKTPTRADAGAGGGITAIPDMGADVVGASPKSPRQSLQIPLPVVDILVSSFGGLGSRKSVGRCPPADVLLTQLRDYSFLGCVHFMADILSQIKPVIDIASRSDMPTRTLGEIVEPASHTLDQRLRAYIGTVRDAIESVTLMYGDESASTDEGGEGPVGDATDDEYHGFHLNEFMQLTEDRSSGDECWFRTFSVANYNGAVSQAALVELIRTVSSAILHDLHQRFGARDIATIQALADMWDPTQFPRAATGVAGFAVGPSEVLARHLSQRPADNNASLLPLPSIERSLSNMPLIDAQAVAAEWAEFKAEVYREAAMQASRDHQGRQPGLVAPGRIQLLYREKLFPNGSLAPSRRRLRSVESTQEKTESAHQSANAWSRFGNLAKLVTAWNVMPLALSTDLHHFRRLYERQLSRICREQAENKLQSISFDIGDTFSELLGRLAAPQQHQGRGRKVTVYDLLENSKMEVEKEFTDSEKPVLGIELSGVTIDYFLRSIDAVTMALDHRLRLLSLDLNEAPLSVCSSAGSSPKWLLNAMRGYWKLACRPPRTSSTRYQHGSRHRKHAQSSATTNAVSVSAQSTNSVTGVPGSTSTTSQISDHHDIASSAMVSKQRSSVSAPSMDVSSQPAVFPGLVQSMQTTLNMQTLSGNNGGYSQISVNPTTSSSSVLMSRATAQPVDTDDISTLPLLEALLSGPNTAVSQPPESAPVSMSSHMSMMGAPQQQQQQGMISLAQPASAGGGLAMSNKRPYELCMPTSAPSGTGAAQQPNFVYSSSMVDCHTAAAMVAPQQQQRIPGTLTLPPSKRMRPGVGGDNPGYQYQEALNNMRQQQQQQLMSDQQGRQDTEILGSAIARLASDMGLDAVSTQVLAASISNQQQQQSGQLLSSRETADESSLAMANNMLIGSLGQQQPSGYVANHHHLAFNPQHMHMSQGIGNNIPISNTHSRQAFANLHVGQIVEHGGQQQQQQQQQAFDYHMRGFMSEQGK